MQGGGVLGGGGDRGGGGEKSRAGSGAEKPRAGDIAAELSGDAAGRVRAVRASGDGAAAPPAEALAAGSTTKPSDARGRRRGVAWGVVDWAAGC